MPLFLLIILFASVEPSRITVTEHRFNPIQPAIKDSQDYEMKHHQRRIFIRPNL